MPTTVDVENFGSIDFPDEMSPGQISDALRKQFTTPTLGEKLSSALGAIPRGAVDVAASIPESIAIAARELDRRVINLSGIPDDAPLSDRGLFQLGQWMRKETAEAFPKDPRLEDSFWAEQVPSGIGSTVGFLGTGMGLGAARNVAGRVLAKKAVETAAEKALQDAVLTTTGKGLEFVAKAAPIMASGAMVNAVQGYKDAIDNKADEDTAIASFVANGVGGIAEATPIQRILNRINRSTGGGISKAIRDILSSGAEELIQESGQQTLGNVIAQNLYDSEREALEGVAAAGGVGGVTGALLSALGIGGKRLLRGAQPAADQFQDPATGEWLSADEYAARQRPPETKIVTPFIPAVTPTQEEQDAAKIRIEQESEELERQRIAAQLQAQGANRIVTTTQPTGGEGAGSRDLTLPSTPEKPTAKVALLRANARLAANFPIQESYSDKFSVSLQIATADPSALTKAAVLESLPAELRPLAEVRIFSGEIVPTNPMLSVPSRIQLTFPNKATAQQAIDHFTAPGMPSVAPESLSPAIISRGRFRPSPTQQTVRPATVTTPPTVAQPATVETPAVLLEPGMVLTAKADGANWYVERISQGVARVSKVGEPGRAIAIMENEYQADFDVQGKEVPVQTIPTPAKPPVEAKAKQSPEDAVSLTFVSATKEQVDLAIQAVKEADYGKFSSPAEAVQKKYMMLATKAMTPEFGDFAGIKNAKKLLEVLAEYPELQKAPPVTAPVPSPKPITPKQQIAIDAKEFDDLLWPFGYTRDPSTQTKKWHGGKVLQSEQVQAARAKAFSELRAEGNSTNPADRAALLPKLKAHVEKVIAFNQNAESRPVNTLGVGDKFTIIGEPHEVIEVTADGDVMIRGRSPKRLRDEDSIQIDPGSYVPVDQSGDDFPSPEPAPLKLDQPESVADQKARLAREEAERKAKEAREKIAEGAAKPLVGKTGDIGQGDLLDGGDLFSPKTPSKPTGVLADLEASMTPEERAELAALEAELKKKLGQSNIGVDPTLVTTGGRIAFLYAKAGVRKFRDFANRMLAKFGETGRQYLMTWYNNARMQAGGEGWDNEAEAQRIYDAEFAGRLESGRAVPETVGGPGAKRSPVARVVRRELIPQPRSYVRTDSYAAKSGFTLGEEQTDGINQAITHFLDRNGRAFVIADGTGFGKTAQLLGIADQFKKARTNARILFVTQNQQMIKGSITGDSRAMGIDLGGITLTTYSKLHSLTERDFDLVIFDEAHNLKNGEARKSMAAARVRAAHKLFSTATPMDKPSGAAYFLAEITGKDEVDVANELGYTFQQRIDPYTQEPHTYAVLKPGFSWAKVWANIIAYRDAAIGGGAMLRREYPFYGQVNVQAMPMDRRAKMEQETIERHYDRLIDGASMPSARRNYSGQKTLTLRRWAEQQKVEEAFRQALEHVNSGGQVIIMAETDKPQSFPVTVKGATIGQNEKGRTIWRAPGAIEQLTALFEKAGIQVAHIHDTTRYNVAEEVDKFQTRRAPVALATPQSGGAGINLDDVIGDKPRLLEILSKNLAGDLWDQVLGRVSRKTTQSEARVEVLSMPDAYGDQRAEDILDKKIRTLRAIQGGEDLDTATGFEAEQHAASKQGISTGIERGTNEDANTNAANSAGVAVRLEQSGEVLWGTTSEINEVLARSGQPRVGQPGTARQSELAEARGVRAGKEATSAAPVQKARIFIPTDTATPAARRNSDILAHRIIYGTWGPSESEVQLLGHAAFGFALRAKLNKPRVVFRRIPAEAGRNPPAMRYDRIPGIGDFISVNIDQIGNFDFSDQGQRLEMDAVLSEELIHAATLRLSSDEELAKVWQSLSPKEQSDVRGIYPRITNDFEGGAEYVRLVLQERFTGTVTEQHRWRITDEIRNILRKLVNFLKEAFGAKPADNIARHVIERIEGAIKGNAPIVGSIFDESQSVSTGISRPAIDEDLGKLADELGTIRSQDEEGVFTKVGNVHDQVLSRPGLNNAVREDSVANAENALQEAGLAVARHDDGLFELVDTVTPQEESGQNLVTILEREIQSARAENRPERIANLLNTVVVHLARDNNEAFSQATKNRLYALAQGERSAFGRALGGLAMWGKVLANVARNPAIHLNQIYSDNFGGDDISEVLERLRKILGNKPTAQEIEDALDKVQSEFSKKNRLFDKGSKLWGKIQKAVRSGLFDPGPILEGLARENGWTVPTEDQKAWLREQVEKEERLREPTQRQIDNAGGDIDKATAEAAKGTESERLKIIKDIQAHWSRWSQPISWNPFKWTAQTRRNNAKAINEFVAANFLFTPGFPVRQWMDVMLTSLPLNAVNRTLVHVVERGSPSELFAATGEMLVARIASLKATLRAMERAAGGNLDRKVLDRMTHSIGVFERMRVKADELEAKGNQAGALAIRLASILQAGYRVASVFDASQATGLEWQEMRQQLSTDLRAQGKSRAEISTQLNDILGGIHVDMAEAIAEVTAIKQERGLPLNKKTIEQDAWALIKARAYDRMRQATGTDTDYQAENEQLRELHSWNLPETGGIGGAIAGTIDFIKRYTEKAGIPTAGLFSFGNAMGIAANRMATFSGGGLFGGFGFGDSPWYQGERNIRQRRIEAIEGLAVVGLLVALAAAGKILIMTRYPDDKEEKERFIAEGHKLNTVRFIQDDGRWIEYPIAMSPFSFIASPLYMIGGIQRLLINQQKAQERLNAEAAKTGAAPGQAKAIGPGDVLGVVAQGMYGMLTGGRTASGAVQSFSDYGDFNLNRASSSLVRGYIPGVPAWQTVSRMMGVAIDSRTATLFEQLVPVPGTQHQRVNSVGDPMTNPNDAVRVLQVLTSGVGFGSDSTKSDYAYRQLASAGYAAPAIGRNKGHNFGGTIRPFTPKEYERYTVERGKAFRQELEALWSLDGLGPDDARKAAQGAFQRANQRALASVGVSEMKPKRAYTRRLRSIGGITRRGRTGAGRIRRGRTPSFGKLRTARAPRLKRAVLTGTRKQRVQRIVPANY